MALNKSKNWRALLCHTISYSLCFLPFGLWFTVVTLVLHTVTDAITSRWTTKTWFIELDPTVSGQLDVAEVFQGFPTGKLKRFHYVANVFPEKRSWFFTIIGFDQLIHAVTLVWTLKLLA